MADFTFNIAKGRVAYYASLPGLTDGLIAVPIEASGLVADDTLRDYANLSTLLAGATNEQTTLGRKTMTGVTVTVDNTNNRVDVDMDDFAWNTATGNGLGALLFCYDPDATGGTDTEIIPLAKYDFVATPNGGNLNVIMPAGGWFRAT